MPNGEDKPYELNISWWSAMSDTGVNPNNFQFERFILSQLFVMALKGVPAFYFQSLMASENDLISFGNSGERRDLNRERFDLNKLEVILKDPTSAASKNLSKLKKTMNIRRQYNAFHPKENMQCLTPDQNDFVIICRGKKNDRVWAVHNMTNSKLSMSLLDYLKMEKQNQTCWFDILNGVNYQDNYIEMQPYSVHWLIQKK